LVAESRTAEGEFAGSRIAWNGWGWDLAMPDGQTYLSPEAYNAVRPQQGSIVGIFDSEGHEVKLTRAPNGDLQEITSPSGHWIRLAYNNLGQVASAADDAGDRADYLYDSKSYLQTVLSAGRETNYTYDPSGILVGVSTPNSFDLLYEHNQAEKSLQLTMNGDRYKLQLLNNIAGSAKEGGSIHFKISGPAAEHKE
jgi:YD repeat-containing protein